MKTTFDQCVNNDPKEKRIFEKEYNEFLLSEFVLEKMEEEHVSIRTLAKRAGVSPAVIQKIRSRNAEKINYRTFSSVLNSLGYRINIEKIIYKERKLHITWQHSCRKLLALRPPVDVCCFKIRNAAP
jgi:Zn-dependent peptidase ImmA (M78 family)